MESLTYHFLFNLSLMITLFYVFYISTEEWGIGRFKLPAILFYSSALVLTFIFSYPLSDNFVIDMRFVPFLIGSLYHPFALLLGMLAITIRGVFGINEGFLLNTFAYSAISLLVWKLRPSFLTLSPYLRMIIISLTTSLHSLVTLIIIQIWVPHGFPFETWFAAIAITAISSLILTFLIELIHYNNQTERHLVKAERLKAIEQMGAAISHDIRNPLTAAIGFTELLSSSTTDDKNRQYYTAILKSEIEKAEGILQNYLTFSKPGKMSFSSVEVDEEIQKIIQLLQPLANYHSVNIATNLNSRGLIYVDRYKFQESLTALIRQAVISIEIGGHLLIGSSISGNRVSVRIEIQDAAVIVRDFTEQHFGEQSTLLSAFHTVKAMKGTIENKSSPLGYSMLLTFKRI